MKGAYRRLAENVFVLGPTGVGKGFVACALAQKACRGRGLEMARADGSLRSLLVRLCRIDVLVIDDWATGTPSV